MGGRRSENTCITENKIFDGRCEGIFLLNSCESWILRNEIYGNYEGIVMVTSIPLIENNDIHHNKSIGIMILKNSKPKLLKNQINHNRIIGLFIRDNSSGYIKDNVVTFLYIF